LDFGVLRASVSVGAVSGIWPVGFRRAAGFGKRGRGFRDLPCRTSACCAPVRCAVVIMRTLVELAPYAVAPRRRQVGVLGAEVAVAA